MSSGGGEVIPGAENEMAHLRCRKVRKIQHKGKPAALKLCQLSDRSALINQEASLLASLHHHNIVKLLDGGLPAPFDRSVYGGFVMEMASLSLEDVIFPLQFKSCRLYRHFEAAIYGLYNVLCWISDMGAALEYLHGRSLLHGDVKPCNMLLFDQYSKLKLCDFEVSAQLAAVAAAQCKSSQGAPPVETSHSAPDLNGVGGGCVAFSSDGSSSPDSAICLSENLEPLHISGGGAPFVSLDNFHHSYSSHESLTLSSYHAAAGGNRCCSRRSPQQDAEVLKLSPSYAPPEVLKGQPYTAASDMYCLGISMWEMISRSQAFHNIDDDNVLFFSIVTDCRPPEIPGIPHQLEALYKSCWAQDPGSRISATQLIDKCKQLVPKYSKRQISFRDVSLSTTRNSENGESQYERMLSQISCLEPDASFTAFTCHSCSCLASKPTGCSSSHGSRLVSRFDILANE